MNHNQYPLSEDRSGDLEASSGFTNHERIVDAMEDPEAESGYYHSPNDERDDEWDDYKDFDDEETEDPLAGDVDKFVHPDETRTDEQLAYDERVARNLHMSGDGGADEHWADYDEYFGTVNGGEQPETERAKD